MNRITTFKEYISSITILTSGTAYSEPPQLFIDAPTRTHDTSDNTQAVATLSIDGGGAISRKEFHSGITALGMDATKNEVCMH